MDPRQLFHDDRLLGVCVHCGGVPENQARDHSPSKTLLDDPLPPDLPVVEACLACNSGFSLDEEYFSCFLECAIQGTTDAARISQPKVARTLAARPSLANQINAARENTLFGEQIFWKPD